MAMEDAVCLGLCADAADGQFEKVFVEYQKKRMIRATLFGVMAGGEPGARRALEILSQELERAMRLCGARSVAEIGPELVSRTP